MMGTFEWCMLVIVAFGICVGVHVLVDIASDIRGIRRLVDDARCAQISEQQRAAFARKP